MNGSSARLGWLIVATSAAVGARAPAADLQLPGATACLSQQVGITTIRVEYTRPALRELVLPPPESPSMPGDIPVPRITFSRDVEFLGSAVAAGTYALLLVPGASDWVVVLNRDLELTGAARRRPDLDVVRGRARVHAGPARDRPEFTFADFTDEGGVLQLAWSDRRVDLPVQVHTHEQIAAAIASLDDAWRWYADAAEYLWKVRYDSAAGLRYIEKSIALQPNERNATLRTSLLAAQAPRPAHAAIAPASTGDPTSPERRAPARAQAASPSPAATQIAGDVERGRAELQACYQRALRRDPALTRARVDIQIDVGTSGLVKAIRLAPARPPPALEACIRGTVARWVFPPSSAEYRTNLPLVVRGQE